MILPTYIIMLDALTSERLIVLCFYYYPKRFSDIEKDRAKDMKTSVTCGSVNKLKIKTGSRVMLMAKLIFKKD